MPDVPIYGNADRDVSPVLKAMVKGQHAAVVGLIGEGTSLELVSNWNSPYEGESLGSLFAKAAAGIQMITGRTTVTTLASRQTWERNEPHLFNLVLKLYALSDPVAEVERPIRELEKMMLPDLGKWLPGGRIPQEVQVNIGRNRIYQECVITNMSIPLDKERDKNGNLIRCEVTLQIESIEMLIAKVSEE